MPGLSPVQRTMKLLRDQGQVAWVVERFISMAGPHGKRIDLYNIIDILCINALTTTGVQACGSDFAEHVRKLSIDKADETITWLEGPRELHLIGWRKVQMFRGSRALRWRPRIGHFKLDADNIVFTEHK